METPPTTQEEAEAYAVEKLRSLLQPVPRLTIRDYLSTLYENLGTMVGWTPAEPSVALVIPNSKPAEESFINAISIRDSSFGQYLESINTKNTWFEKIQIFLGYTEPEPVTALDAVYIGTGVVGTALLVPISVASAPIAGPLIAVSATLLMCSAIGMSEEKRRQKIATGIGVGAVVVWKPEVVAFATKEAYSATKETAKQTVELAKTTLGLTTAAFGFGTALVGGAFFLLLGSPPKKKVHRTPPSTRKRKRS